MDARNIELPRTLVRKVLNLPGGRAWVEAWADIANRYLETWDLVLELEPGA